jgi:hypothetical protein
MNDKDKKRLDALFAEACDIIQSSSDSDIPQLLGDGIIQTLIDAIAEPKTDVKQSIYDYFLQNKNRLQLLSLIRLVILTRYSIKGKIKNTDVYVSPHHIQWFENGVMFVQGDKQFEGLIGLYQDGRLKFALAARDIRGGDKLGPDAFNFIDLDEMEKRSNQPSIPKSTNDLDAVICRLENLLHEGASDEATYQMYLSDNPWVFGAQYARVDSHISLNDENIPDFTAVRVSDSSRDIIEIKSPFLQLFRDDGSFRADFNNAWNKAERYLDFTRREADYLRRQKGIFFDNPKCILLAGYQLSESQVAEFRIKERMNPAITILTYNDLLAIARSTVSFFKTLKG